MPYMGFHGRLLHHGEIMILDQTLLLFVYRMFPLCYDLSMHPYKLAPPLLNHLQEDKCMVGSCALSVLKVLS